MSAGLITPALVAGGGDEVTLKTSSERYRCPKCTWDFVFRKKRRCSSCGTLLLIPSDKIPEKELGGLGSFWMWNPAKEKWVLIRNWEEHKRKALERLDKHLGFVEKLEPRRRLT